VAKERLEVTESRRWSCILANQGRDRCLGVTMTSIQYRDVWLSWNICRGLLGHELPEELLLITEPSLITFYVEDFDSLEREGDVVPPA